MYVHLYIYMHTYAFVCLDCMYVDTNVLYRFISTLLTKAEILEIALHLTTYSYN